MRKIREILRLRLAAGLSLRQISASTKVSTGAVQKLLCKTKELGLSWPLPEALDDHQLALLFYLPLMPVRLSAISSLIAPRCI